MPAFPKPTPLRLALIALAGALVLLAAGGAWLVLTAAGLARVVAAVESLEAIRIRVDGAEGRLAGPLRLRHLEVEAGSIRIVADGVDADYDPVAMLFGRIRVASLGADAVTITLGPREEPEPERRPRFLPRWLSVSVGELAIRRIVIADETRRLLEIDAVRARGTVTHARIVLDELAADAGVFSVAGRAGLRAAEPLGLEGDVDFTLGSGRQLAGHLAAKGSLAELAATANVHRPFEGTLSATLTDVATALAWRGELALARLDLAQYLPEPPVGPLSGELSGSGSLTRMFLEGHLDGAGLPGGGVDFSTHFSRSGSVLDVDNLDLAVTDQDLSLEAQGRVALAEPFGVEAEARWRNLRWPFEGEALATSESGQLSVSGWSPLTLTVAGQLDTPTLPAFDVQAQGLLSESGLLLTQAEAQGALGRLAGSGFVGFGEQRPWQLVAQVAALDLGRLRPGLDSRLDFGVTASGSGTGAGIAWAGALSDLSGTVRDQPAAGSGLVRYQPGRVEFERLLLDLGPARLSANGHTGTDTRLAAELYADDLAGFRPDLGGSVEARLEARRSGPRGGLLLDLALRGRDVSLGNDRAAVLSADALVDLSDATSSFVRIRAAGLTVAGQPISSTRLSLDGRARDHRFAIGVGAGERAVELAGTGAFVDGVYRASAARIAAAGPGVRPWSLEAPMNVLAAADRAELDRTCFVHEARRVCVAARWDRGVRWTAALDTVAFPLQRLNVTLPGRPGYEGLLDLEVALEGVAGQPWTGRAVGRLRDGALSYLTPSRREERLSLGVTELVVDSTPQEHRISLEIRGSDLVRSTAEARIARVPDTRLGDSPLAGRIELATRQLGLLPLLLPEVDRASGQVDARLALGGTVSAPQFTGALTLADGAIDLYTVNLRMSDVNARLDFEDRRLGLDATGQVGQGRFAVAGSLGWDGGEPAGRFRLTGDRLLMSDLPELRVEASPALDFAIDGRRIDVSGSVTVPDARIEPRQFVGAVMPSADERLVDGDGGGAGAESDWLVSTDVRLVLGKAVRIDAFGLKGRLEGEVVARTRPGEVPIAAGELEIEDAKYKAYSRELEVERGRLLFPGGPVADPGIDLRATKEVPGYEVGVIVRGRLRRPELTLWSDPSLPQSQIASLLVVGRSLESLQAGDRQSFGSSSELAAQGGALLAGQIGRHVGLDEVAFEAGVDREASVVLGKFLSPRLYIGYGISLTDSINTFKLRYTVGDRWEVRGEAGEEQSVDIEYTIDR